MYTHVLYIYLYDVLLMYMYIQQDIITTSMWSRVSTSTMSARKWKIRLKVAIKQYLYLLLLKNQMSKIQGIIAIKMSEIQDILKTSGS